MTLSEFRKLFVSLTGRYDLVKDTENYADDGADQLINMGVRKLDSMFTHSKSMGKVPMELTLSQAIYSPSHLLSIEGMIMSADDGRVSLDHKREEWIEQRNLESADAGCPQYYAISSMNTDNIGEAVDGYSKLNFIIFPKPDQEYTLDVYGRVTIPLDGDEDYNYWTVNHPETLVSATMYMIERFHRNRQGMADHMTAIRADLRDLDYNAIESQIGSNTQMNDSFNSRPQGNEW